MQRTDILLSRSISSRLLLGLICLAIGMTCVRGFAQEAEEEGVLPAYTIEEVVVTEKRTERSGFNSISTKMPVPLRSTPASVGVVTHALMKSQDNTILGDALGNVSGVNVQTGFGVHDFFVIRGFDSLSNGLVLTDGAAEPEVTFYNLYNIERVEVLKGPGAFLYGGNPLSGTVDLVRKQPVFRDFAHIAGSYGRFQSYRGTLDAGMARPDAGVAFRLNALWQDAENYRDNKDSSGISVNPALKWRPNQHTSVVFNFEYAHSEHSTDSGLPVFGSELPQVPRKRSYQSPFDVSDQDIARARIDFTTRLGEVLHLRNKLYYTDFDWESRGTLLTGPARNERFEILPGQLGRTLTLLDDRQKFLGNQFEALLEFATGPVHHTLLAGLELARQGDEFTLNVAALPSIDIQDPVETAAEQLFVIPNLSQEADARSLIVAPYFVDRVALSEKYQVFAGGRYDAIDYEDSFNDINQTFNKFSPMAGLVYAPLQDLSLYGNVGQAFAPPSTLGKGERRAEESTQFEVGARKVFFGGKVNAGLALYHLSKDVSSDDGQTRLAGEQRSRGLEVELAAQPMPRWQTVASYAYSVAELMEFEELFRIPTPDGNVSEVPFDRSGKEPAFAPEHLLNVWTTRQFDYGLDVGGGARYVGSQFIAADNAFEIDGVLKFDASIRFKQGPGQLRLNFQNLTNRKYQTRGFGSTSVIPAAPFAVYGAVEWAF